MAYGSIADIRLLGYIPDEDLDALDDENPDRIPKLFDAESGKFDAYMRPRYGVPWPDETIPIEVTDAVVALVVFRLYITRGFPSIPEGSEVAKEIHASRERAEKFRQDVRDGVAQLKWREDATPENHEAGPKTGTAAMPNQIKSGSFRGTTVGRIPRGGCC
jgi:hypothetical protein